MFFSKYRWVLLIVLIFSSSLRAAICPDPNLSSLQQGVVPAPWVVSPFSDHAPQGERGAQFVRATILVAGMMGRGVACTYQNSVGYYSIWWQVNVKVPARVDYSWRDTLGGYECSGSVDYCIFYSAFG